MNLVYGSLFSGCGGMDMGFDRAGWRCAWQSEIDKDAASVLRRHWPDVPQLGSVTDVRGDQIEPVDAIIGGFPCQDLSLAGKRKGLDGERSGLFYEFLRIVGEMREATNGRYPAVALFENVDGLLSSNAGRDFAHVLAGLQDRGAAVAFRVLDAQFFGVPQRRRRVFIVADFAPVGVGEERAAQVLALGESLCGHPEAGDEAGQGSAGAAEDGAGVGGVVCSESGPGWWNEGFGCLRAEGENRPSRPSHVVLEPAVIGTITANYGNQNGQDAYGCLIAEPVAAEGGKRADFGGTPGGVAYTDSAGLRWIVRRLTPTEGERCQGWPDSWTRYRDDGREISDSSRWRMIGNGVATPVAEWIARRLRAALEAS